MRFKLDFWSPEQIDIYVWYDLADETSVTLNGTNVSQIDDKSGNDRHVIQSEAAKQFSYNTTTLNGLKVATSDGVDDYLHNWVTGLPTSFSYLFVFKPNVVSSNHDSIASISSNGNDWQFRSNNETQFNGLVDTDKNGTVEFNQNNVTDWALWGFDAIANTSLTTYFNGNQEKVNNNYTEFDTSGTFKLSVNRNGIRTLGADFAELIMFPREHREKVEGYLAWKWGLTNLLPSNHPYKNRRP